MRAFQLVLSAIFALLVWALLELGAALFHLIHLESFRNMIGHNWFRCPALAVAFAAPTTRFVKIRDFLDESSHSRKAATNLLSAIVRIFEAGDRRKALVPRLVRNSTFIEPFNVLA
jgi:hypothetical protein